MGFYKASYSWWCGIEGDVLPFYILYDDIFALVDSCPGVALKLFGDVVWNLREIVAGHEVLNFVIVIIFIQYYQGVYLICFCDHSLVFS